VRGFTWETTTTLLTTIGSIEWKREYANKGLVPVEHPRASTTDDVECFFSMVRDLLGSFFRLTTVMQEWRKICVERDKRLDPSFHSITTPLTMRGNVPHSTMSTFLDELVWWSRTPFQFANSFINFLLHYFFRSISCLRILSVSGCICVVVLLLTS